MRQNASLWSLILVAAGFSGYSLPVRSEDLLNDTFNVSLGTFLLSTDTHVRINGTVTQTDTDVDLGRDLGVGDKDRFRVDAIWRFAKRHKLRAMYFNTSATADRAITRELTIRDTVYPVNTTLHTDNSTWIAELAYEYAFWQGPTYEVAGTFGVHALNFKFGVSGTGSVGGQSGQFHSETADTTAPLPVIGARGLWQFKPQWYLDAQVQYFGLKVGDVDGHLSDVRVGVTRMFGEHFGVGAGWNQFVTRVNIDKVSFDGALRWRYSGAMLYVMAAL